MLMIEWREIVILFWERVELFLLVCQMARVELREEWRAAPLRWNENDLANTKQDGECTGTINPSYSI